MSLFLSIVELEDRVQVGVPPLVPQSPTLSSLSLLEHDALSFPTYYLPLGDIVASRMGGFQISAFTTATS